VLWVNGRCWCLSDAEDVDEVAGKVRGGRKGRRRAGILRRGVCVCGGSIVGVNAWRDVDVCVGL
jgi:hypothetical protein